MSLVRLTLNRETNDIMVEYGEIFYRDLNTEEQKEIKTLEKQLANFEDFTTAAKLQDDQRKGVMEKKRRYMELQQLPTTPQIEWKTSDPAPKSILLMMRPGPPDDSVNYSVEYVENMPDFLFEKMTSTDININLTGGSMKMMDPDSGEPKPREIPMARNRVEAKLYEIRSKLSKPWDELVSIEVKGNMYHIAAKIWLDADFAPIDDAMRATVANGGLAGKWVSLGKGDKNAHWEIPL